MTAFIHLKAHSANMALLIPCQSTVQMHVILYFTVAIKQCYVTTGRWFAVRKSSLHAGEHAVNTKGKFLTPNLGSCVDCMICSPSPNRGPWQQSHVAEVWRSCLTSSGRADPYNWAMLCLVMHTADRSNNCYNTIQSAKKKATSKES